MCLVVLAWKSHPDYRLILAANRDEFHGRPSAGATWWDDQPSILAGRDLQAGGTWLAVSGSGRFATVTNYREQQRPRLGLRSRGELVTNFVAGGDGPLPYATSLDGERYAGFSLLTADAEELACVSNRGDDAVALEPGVYGLSNASLDTPWTKLVRSKDALVDLLSDDRIDEEALLKLVADRQTAPAADIQSDELPFDLARALTAPFIVAPEYGTRCSTVVLIGTDGSVRFTERRFGPDGEQAGESRFQFDSA